LKEIKRLKVIMMLEEVVMPRAEAEERLGISERHVYPIQKFYHEKEEQGLERGNFVKPSLRRTCSVVKTNIKALLSE